MPVSKRRKKLGKKKIDYNKNKISKVIKNYSKLLDNYIPLLIDLPVVEQTPYNLSKLHGLGELTLSSPQLSAVIKPLINNKSLDFETIQSNLKIRTTLMLSIHILLDIMPDDIEENNFIDKLKYYYSLVDTFYKLDSIPFTKNPENTTFFIKDLYLSK